MESAPIDPEEDKEGVVVHAVRALDNDQHYAMVDSGTNPIIVPLHPAMRGDIAERQVPNATVTGPTAQVFEHLGARQLVVALPQSAILISQERLITVAGWTFVSGPTPHGKGRCENPAEELTSWQ